MKNFKVLVLIVSAFLMQSCSNDDSDKPSLAGLWHLDAWFDNEARDIDNDGTASTDLLAQWSGCNQHANMLLGAGEDSNTSRFIYAGGENHPECEGVDTGAYNYFPWKVEKQENGNDELVFIGSDFFERYEIVELTATTLILKDAGLYVSDGYTGGYLKFSKILEE